MAEPADNGRRKRTPERSSIASSKEIAAIQSRLRSVPRRAISKQWDEGLEV